MPSKNDFVPHIPPEQASNCEAKGCMEKGTYKAPKANDRLNEYQWLCLEHIREHNKQWDYFKGMDAQEIENFHHDAVTGHRPTWNRETRMREPMAALQDALYEFIAGDKRRAKKPQPPLPVKVRKALALLDLEYPYNIKELKSTYRLLVKKHHPDLNEGNKLSEEKFKKITESYHLLAAHLKSDSYKA
ncbi:MAG: DnaJ domain-containing protein [Rickettsiales bacterium]